MTTQSPLVTPGAEELAAVARRICAQAVGNEQIEAAVTVDRSTTVRVYGGEVESLKSGVSAAIGVRVVADGCQGFASAGSLDEQVIDSVLAAARQNVEFAQHDPDQQLAHSDGVPISTLAPADPSLLDIDESVKIAAAVDLERRCLSADPRISSVRVTIWNDHWSQSALASSTGICASAEDGNCSIVAQPLAAVGNETQTGFASDAARRLEDLCLDDVAHEATSLAIGQLGATKPRSAKLNAVLEPRVAASLLGIVASVLTGESVLKGRSPFADRVGERIASELLTLADEPTDASRLSATAFDGEGLATRANTLIDRGRLAGFVHNTYTARRCGVSSTGSAVRSARSTPGVGMHAMAVPAGATSRDELMRLVGDGIVVRGVSGLHSGVNPTSGDFSVGAWGHRVRNGELAEPYREATIASTLQRMLLDVVAVSSDTCRLIDGMAMPWIAVSDMSLAGT